MENHKHYEKAKMAYQRMSFSPDKRAESECAFFDEIMNEFSDNEQAQTQFESLFLKSLTSKSNCISSMVTGPAKFPVARAQKANEREHKSTGDMFAFIDKIRKAKKQAEYYIKHPESKPIASNDVDAIKKLKEKLALLEKQQETMKTVNKIVRKNPIDMQALADALGSEERAQEILKPDYFGGVGFQSFSLTNNNAKIKSVRDRIASIQNCKALPDKEVTINGVRVIENKDIMRLQLLFQGKPSFTIRDKLKSNGFKWAPSQNAWQRQLTSNAIYSFNNFIKPILNEAQS